MMQSKSERSRLLFNYVVNMFDGAFFGFGMGFSSFSAIIPLFVANLTDSAILIGLIPSIHNMGWQLPQLLTANRLARLQTYKPFVLRMTINERLPFFFMAIVAWFSPGIPKPVSLVLIFLLLIWQGLGAGFAANPWQNLIGKVIPSDYLATFFGLQSSAANLLSSLGSAFAGIILIAMVNPTNFALLFLLTFLMMAISWGFLSFTKEKETIIQEAQTNQPPLLSRIRSILEKDHNFRWFMAVRILFQFGLMAFSFYTVYVVKYLSATEAEAAYLASALMIVQTIANPLLGWLSDRFTRRKIMILGAVANVLSALIACLAPSIGWFVPVMIFAGLSNVAFWTIGIAMTMEYGTETERPTYIGMANSFIAPATILAPFLGGLLADAVSYQATFILAVIASLVTFLVLVLFVKDNQRVKKLAVE